MKKNKEKYIIFSVITLMIGWVYFFIINYLNYSDFMQQFNHNDGLLVPILRSGIYDTLWFKFIAVGFGIVSLYFGYKSKAHIHRKLRILLISLSLLLIIISIVAFPNIIWKYIIS